MAIEFNNEDDIVISSNADEDLEKPDGEIYDDPSDIPNREE